MQRKLLARMAGKSGTGFQPVFIRSQARSLCHCRRNFRGKLLGEQDSEIKKELHGGRRGEKQIAQCIRRDRPKNHFPFGERFFFGGNAQKNFALTVPLAGPEGHNVDLAKILVSPRKIDAARDHAKNVIGRPAGGHDSLLIVFDESAVELKLDDELFADARKKPIARQAELPRSRLMFG
jgi:hypothetical protein